MDYFSKEFKKSTKLSSILMTVFKSEANLNWLKNARKYEDTNELADKVWNQLLDEYAKEDIGPEEVMKNLMLDVKKEDDKVEHDKYFNKLKDLKELERKSEVKWSEADKEARRKREKGREVKD